MLRRLLSICLVLSFLLIAAPSARAAQRCFPETGHCIDGRFLEYWEGNGGLPVFGYPLAPARNEVNRDTGQTYLTQWFERNRFELHLENGRPYDVLLGRLGDDRLIQQGRSWHSFPKADPNTPHYFPTGHAIADVFWGYWSTHGLELGDNGTSERESLALWGMPISPASMETNASGDTVLTQWFERARFEYHPTKPEPYKVLLGLLGNEVRGPAEPPPPPPPPAAVNIINNHTHYFDSIGNAWVEGEVKNDLSTNVEFVKVTASLYNAANALVGIESGYAKIDILRPGQRSPFEILISDVPADFHHYVLSVSWQQTAKPAVHNFAIVASGDRDTALSGMREIFGQVRNDNGFRARFVEVIITVYDGANRVVQTDSTYIEGAHLDAGQTGTFIAYVIAWNGGTRYEIQVQGMR